MKSNQNKRQHYIPRFIFKDFINSRGNVNYYSIKEGSSKKKYSLNVFMKRYMYKDSSNIDDPLEIEHNLSILENEISTLINSKIKNNEKEIILTRRELEKLRIFFAILTFRTNVRKEQYKNNDFNEVTRNMLLKFQPDGDFLSLWKKELLALSKCKTYFDIINSKDIDDLIKEDFLVLLKDYFMTFVDTSDLEFIIGDVYPTTEAYPIENNTGHIHMHYIFPISEKRCILLNHVMFLKGNSSNIEVFKYLLRSNIKGDILGEPTTSYVNNIDWNNPVFDYGDVFKYEVKLLDDNHVKYINMLMLNEATEGFIFKHKEKVAPSIEAYNNLPFSKKNNFKNF